MIDIDLEAIRERDLQWFDRGRRIDTAGRDRRLLLQYIAELDTELQGLQFDIRRLRQVHDAHYQAKPAALETPEEP